VTEGCTYALCGMKEVIRQSKSKNSDQNSTTSGPCPSALAPPISLRRCAQSTGRQMFGPLCDR
jgi:hypothetical protein